MSEIDHVRGIQDAKHADLPGPPYQPLGGAGITDQDLVRKPPANAQPIYTSRRYLLETRSTALGDIETRIGAAYEPHDPPDGHGG